MTNVKLKLTFYLLSALITSDFVHSRPYIDANSTEIVVNFSKNNSDINNADAFNIPVDTNSDTLIVASEDGNGGIDIEVSTVIKTEKEEDKKHKEEDVKIVKHDEAQPQQYTLSKKDAAREEERSKAHQEELKHEEAMIIHEEAKEDARIAHEEAKEEARIEHEEKKEKDRKEELAQKQIKAEQDRDEALSKTIMEAEQDRDEDLSQKSIKVPKNYLDFSNDDLDAFQKQLNISSPILDEIIDAETDREETLTDILFRPESELVADMPRFEFLTAIRINETEKGRSAKDMANIFGLNKVNSSDVRKIDYVELVEVITNAKDSANKSAYNLLNMTSHEVENDVPDTLLSMFAGFTDVQTLFLACFGTLLPLLAVLLALLFVRCLCRRCCRKHSEYSDSSNSEEKPEHQHEELKTEASSVTVVPAVEAETQNQGDTTPAANGSIITMTLKNNHLIVETEERNDITKNGRETTMKYSPESDGIFVVEVQQTTAYRPNKTILHSPPQDPKISTNQALIHRVPEELESNTSKVQSSDELNISESNERIHDKPLALSSTGLSISDLSMSSIGSHNVSYSYGQQIGYEEGPFGYPVYAGYEIPKKPSAEEGFVHENSREPLISKTPTDPDKPVVTAAIFKQDSIIGNDVLQGPGYCIEGSTDGPLLSDVMAREISLHQLHDKIDKKLENGDDHRTHNNKSPKKDVNSPKKDQHTEKKGFFRADTLPTRLEDEPENKNLVMDTIDEDQIVSKEKLKGKRASLPTITTEVYETVKETLKASSSPKFEKLTNDTSPSEIPPPLITITEEIDHKDAVAS